jgi:hypothetical protein
MMPLAIDTLKLDSSKLQVWQQNEDFNYKREILQTDNGFVESLVGKVEKFFNDIYIYGFDLNNKVLLYGCVVLVLLIAIALFLLYRRHHSLFGKLDKGNVDYSISEDTIYGIDFAECIARALDNGDFKAAVRWMYLQTLKRLSDRQQIDWQFFKTPTQYTYEIKTPEFRKLTNIFLYVRYGDFEATRETCLEMEKLQEEVEKGDNNESK